MASSQASQQVPLDPPFISTESLFDEMIFSGEFEGWQVSGMDGIKNWNLYGAALGRIHSMEQSRRFLSVQAITNKPILIKEGTQAFFDGISTEVPFNGTYIGYKYLFHPRALFGSDGPRAGEEPIPFFLFKSAPSPLVIADLADPLSPEEERSRIAKDLASKGFLRMPTGEDRLRCLADLGNPKAQYKLATILVEAEEAFKTEAAINYMKSSADQGYPPAQCDFGVMNYQGWNMPKNMTVALRYVKKAADQGYWEAQGYYAMMLIEGNKPEALAEARLYLDKSVTSPRFETSEYIAYARMLYYGQGGPIDREKAIHYFAKAASESGDPDAQRTYKEMLHLYQAYEGKEQEAAPASDK